MSSPAAVRATTPDTRPRGSRSTSRTVVQVRRVAPASTAASREDPVEVRTTWGDQQVHPGAVLHRTRALASLDSEGHLA